MNGFHLFNTSELFYIRNNQSAAFEAWIYVKNSTMITPKDKHLAGLELISRGFLN